MKYQVIKGCFINQVDNEIINYVLYEEIAFNIIIPKIFFTEKHNK